MNRQVSKPNIFWAPSLETARKIDDEDTVKSIETARYRFSASMADLERCYDERQAGCAPRSSRKWRRFTKAKPHSHKPLPDSRQGFFANRRSK
jgi:hypothetical protein